MPTSAETSVPIDTSYDPGSTVQEVAHCFEVSPAQIYSWRRQVADWTIDRAPCRATPSFARVELSERDNPVMPSIGGAGTMEIRLTDGTAIVVGNDVSEEALVRVLAALGQ